MESPVVLDKPPEYHGVERGFPFDEEEGSGAWSELAARHPDIAARLRQRPATWARKRRPSSQDGIDDTADSFGGFDRFPFDDIPPEFREHFPTHWNRRFGSREDQFQQPPSPQPQSPQQQTIATQTEHDAGPSQEQTSLPQYGLRNTVDLGQKSPADPSVVDADERSQRSMSAPPDHRTVNPNANKMSGQNHQEQQPQPQQEQHSNVRHIPIFVEGRDEPVINRSVDHGTHFADPKPTYVQPPQPHHEREQYFADDSPVGGFPFAKNFDRPFFRQSPQPFTKQKMYPQAYARGGSPQRSQSPKPQSYHDHTVPRPETPSRSQQKQPSPQQKQTPPQQAQTSPQQRQPPSQPTSPQPPQQNHVPPQPPRQQTPSNDPVKQILAIQADVLNIMTEVENFKGTKKDKQYIYLDEMLTRNLIKLDNIETDGKESIRLERKEVIKCIQKCIAVLEAKAENRALATPPPQDVEMQNTGNENPAAEEHNVQNGDVEMKETTKEEAQIEPHIEKEQPQENTIPLPQVQTETKLKEEQIPEETKTDQTQPAEAQEAPQSQIQPDNNTTAAEAKSVEPALEITAQEPQTTPENDEKNSSKKTAKKRDKSKDKQHAPKDSKKAEVLEKKDEPKVDNKVEVTIENVHKKEVNEADVDKEVKENIKENVDDKEKKLEVMQVDAKGDSNKPDSQAMEVDSAASQ